MAGGAYPVACLKQPGAVILERDLEPGSSPNRPQRVPNRPQRACPTGGYCCFRSSERFVGYPGGQGVAGSNPVVPTARSGGILR
jgi:hypothetical protein